MILPLSEFDIIARYFNREGLAARDDARFPLGIGDDCALIEVPDGCHLAVSMDVLGEDVHFPADAPADQVASKALAVNLSDLAAMGAEPAGFTLGLTLPRADEDWLAAFAEGLVPLSFRHDCPLIGGDITRGPLSVAIQVHGFVPRGKALARAGAQPGDLIFISGPLGAAGLGLELVTGRRRFEGHAPAVLGRLERAYYRPEPRVELGIRLRGLAVCAIDVSDGLLADLQHMARAAGVEMRLELNRIPVSPDCETVLGYNGALDYALSAGDDYELAFCAPEGKRKEIEALARELDLACCCIGVVAAGGGSVQCVDRDGRDVPAPKAAGYRHF